MDISGGTSYTVISTTQFVSVPYALYAKTAGSSPADNDWTESGSDIYRNSGNVGIGTSSPAVKLEVSGQARFSSLTHTGTSTNRIVTASSEGDLGTGSINSPISSPSLAGTGDRMVVANANGDLSTQAIPSSSSNSHYIGEIYGGGTVFFVYDNGQHGLIAATSDQSSGVRWFGGSYRVTRARADGVLAGLKNTSIIIADQAAQDGSSFAATLCNEYSVTVNGVIYGDWYLPSKYELNLLYLQKNLVGGFSNYGYWTSTEMDFSNGWAQNMGDGVQFGYLKNFTYRVRAIRAF